ncbi:MAG: SDR family oxidoreductase [Gemmataceae bacterium]|nr:SDR family oxidoreductase [Gemmataceae bacterium]
MPLVPGPDLTGKVALVTGASSGIGRAIAITLGQAGADVALNYARQSGPAESAAAEIRKAGRKAMLLQADVSDQAAVETMVSEMVKELGGVDIFISSAAYSDREPFHSANMAGFRKTIEVSLFGAYYCLRACTNQMLKQARGGAIVITSSPHGKIAFPNAMAYNIAKAGLDQMARSAATELLEHKIRVNVLYPGWTDTPGERKFFTEETIKIAGAKLPAGRLATSEEVAHAALFLVDPRSEYVNGTTLEIEGGLALPWWSKRDEGDF